jgi:hypothetical protein
LNVKHSSRILCAFVGFIGIHPLTCRDDQGRSSRPSEPIMATLVDTFSQK